MTDLSTQTPVEIDTALATIYGEMEVARTRLDSAREHLHYTAGDKRTYGGGWRTSDAEVETATRTIAENDLLPGFKRDEAQRRLEGVDKARAGVKACQAKAAPLDAEFTRRGGWTRAFLVTNSNGHVHSSMNCSSCNRGQSWTSFQWMTAYSAHDEAEIVKAAGWRACTVCYPTAPTTEFSSDKAAKAALPTSMFSKQDEEKAAAKVEREQAKVVREAKRIANAPTKSGAPLMVVTGEGRWDREEFKTERTAMMYAVEWVVDSLNGYSRHPLRLEAVDLIAEAVAEKRGVETSVVRAEITAKAEKKAGLKR